MKLLGTVCLICGIAMLICGVACIFAMANTFIMGGSIMLSIVLNAIGITILTTRSKK